uniref:outer dynein arm-docking complex subunit 4 isoform X5 n=1 Tax=Pristiophorus japonicus TaxID=55135 RepID=UPI00398E7FCA
MADDDEEVLSGPVCSYLTYKSEGDRLYMRGEYEKAIQSYTHALQLEAKNRNCLVARSRCYLTMGNTTAALKDAEASQLGSKEFDKGLYRKAETLYAKGEFELALMFYHRGHKLRPDDHTFRLGIQKAREAIDNSVGSPSSVRLETTGDMSFFYRREEKVVPKTKSQLRRQKLNLKQQSKKQEQGEPKTNKTVRVLLGELYGDKEYLEKLLLDKELMKTNTDSGGTIQDLIMSGITFLDTRTEFWRQQKPIFARERERRMKEISWQSNRARESEQTIYILEALLDIDVLFADRFYEECKNKATELVHTVEGWPKKVVPNKAEFLGNLYNTIGMAQIELGDMEGALRSNQKDLQVAKKYDSSDGKSRALDNIGRVYARIGEFQKAVDAWMEKEPLTKSNLERTWLYHEIGRCHLELNNNNEARKYGLKSLVSAEKAGDEEWKMNANVLVAQAEIKLSNPQTAVTFFEKALGKARQLKDEPAEHAISNALKTGKEKIETDEKTKQEELEQLHKKQRARRPDVSPVVVERIRIEKTSREGAVQRDETFETDAFGSEVCSCSSDSVCGIYSPESGHVSDSSARDSRVSPDQQITQPSSTGRADGEGSEQDARVSPDQQITQPSSMGRADGEGSEQGSTVVDETSKSEKAEDNQECDDTITSVSSDSVCQLPSSPSGHISEASSLASRASSGRKMPHTPSNSYADGIWSDTGFTMSEVGDAIQKLEVFRDTNASHDSNYLDVKGKFRPMVSYSYSSDDSQIEDQLPENTESSFFSDETKAQSDNTEATVEEVTENGEAAEEAETDNEETPEDVSEKGGTSEAAGIGAAAVKAETDNEETLEDASEKGGTSEAAEIGEAAEEAETDNEETPEDVLAKGGMAEEVQREN